MPRQLFDEALAGPGLEVSVHRSSLHPGDADRALASLLEEVPWQQDEIVLFGRTAAVPRLAAWVGDPGHVYSYSGLRLEPRSWTPTLREIRGHVEAVAGHRFNTVLANRYRDGADGVGWHADDEPELGADPVIGSVSLGATRRFRFRRRDDPSITRALELHHGDVIVMSGSTQRLWLHQIPKTAKPVGERINLTFRTIVTDRGS